MSSTTTPKRARLVELYSPELDMTIESFMVTPSETHQDALTHMKAIFRGKMDEVWPHDVNGEPLRDLDTVADGERILVASNRFMRVHAEPELEVKLHVADDSLPKPLKTMSRSSRRSCVHSLRRAEALQRKNVLRLTLPHIDVVSALEALNNATEDQMKRRYSVKYSQSIIKDNWDVKPRFLAEIKCLAAVAILSDATPGQPHRVGELLYDQWKARIQRIGETAPKDMTLIKVDVVAVLNALYERADSVGSVRPGKTLTDKKKKAQKAKAKKVGGSKKRVRDDDEDELKVEHLIVKLKVAHAPEDSDEDEDEDYQVRKPGRH